VVGSSSLPVAPPACGWQQLAGVLVPRRRSPNAALALVPALADAGAASPSLPDPCPKPCQKKHQNKTPNKHTHEDRTPIGPIGHFAVPCPSKPRQSTHRHFVKPTDKMVPRTPTKSQPISLPVCLQSTRWLNSVVKRSVLAVLVCRITFKVAAAPSHQIAPHLALPRHFHRCRASMFPPPPRSAGRLKLRPMHPAPSAPLPLCPHLPLPACPPACLACPPWTQRNLCPSVALASRRLALPSATSPLPLATRRPGPGPRPRSLLPLADRCIAASLVSPPDVPSPVAPPLGGNSSVPRR